jgi:hypothetical protein
VKNRRCVANENCILTSEIFISFQLLDSKGRPIGGDDEDDGPKKRGEADFDEALGQVTSASIEEY